VVYKDQVVFAKGFGVRVLGNPVAVDANTVFQLASVSKPVSSTVIAAVVGDGNVSWGSQISALDPGFSMSEPWVTREIKGRLRVPGGSSLNYGPRLYHLCPASPSAV
jgi:CubicO group peptidase (beta-lactamase class C family)